MGAEQVIIVGAGIGGLAAAIELTAAGQAVTVLERHASPGGKMREVQIGGRRLDAGPTVFTMRDIFDDLFAGAGSRLADWVKLVPLDVLARHAWEHGGRLDLFADPQRTEDAIGRFAGPREAKGYRRFRRDAARLFQSLDQSFMRAERPSLSGLARRAGLGGLASLRVASPFANLWDVLGRYFGDRRLRQLFARYATYSGSSPFLAPATLMLIVHAEQAGVWSVDGGMARLAEAMAGLAANAGAEFQYNAHVAQIRPRPRGGFDVRLASGESLQAGSVILNADVAALALGRLGPDVAEAAPGAKEAERSLSAMTLALVGRAEGFPLHRHNVFFAEDYAAEFTDIFTHGRLPRRPTVYVCAQDRDETRTGRVGQERLFCIVNAPAIADRKDIPAKEIESCRSEALKLLQRCGLTLAYGAEDCEVTTPGTFEGLFPGTGGALYGRAIHDWKASFERPHSRSRIPGLYLAGGGIHPGPGIPMAALSGRMAARALLADRSSMRRFRPAAMPGGMSTR